MRSFFAGCGLALLSTVVACSATSEQTGSSEANVNEAAPRKLGVIKGRELAKCWFDLVGTEQQLSCTSTARGKDPLKVTVRTVVTGSNGVFKDLDVEAGATIVAATYPTTAFTTEQRSLEIQAYLSQDDQHMLGADDGYWMASLDNVDPAKITQASPLVLSEPFDFWELGTILDKANTEGGGYGYKAHEYKRDLGLMASGFVGNKEMVFAPDVFGDIGKVSYIVAPKEEGPLAVTFSHDGKTLEQSIAGPGYYVYSDLGVRVATAEEIAANFAAAPNNGAPNTNNGGAAQPEPQPAPTPEPQPEPEPVKVDPTPGCGAPGEKMCANPSSCDDGARWDYQASKCVACGADGQVQCYGGKHTSSSEGSYCNDGTRWDYQASKCVACGDAGQTQCFGGTHMSSNEGSYCNDGTRWDYQSSTCITCGGEGQTFCYGGKHMSSSEGSSCNAGLRIQGSTCVK